MDVPCHSKCVMLAKEPLLLNDRKPNKKYTSKFKTRKGFISIEDFRDGHQIFIKSINVTLYNGEGGIYTDLSCIPF